MPGFTTLATQALSISAAMLGAGSIATMSVFDIPEMRAQPADRSLPAIRWLFSRGSHIYPQISIASAAGFAYLAYDALPQNLRSLSQLLQTTNGLKVNGFLAAAILAFSIGPWTALVMVPNNFALIKKNEDLGGTRSSANAEQLREDGKTIGQRSAEQSVNSEGDISQWRDLSDPQTKTERSANEKEEREVKEMLDTFGSQNLARALLLGSGGFVGLLAALA